MSGNKIGFKQEPTKAAAKPRGKAKSGKGNPKKTGHKKGKDLGFKGGTPTGNKKKGWSNRIKVSEPKDTKRSDKMSLVFFDSKVLNEITEMCLPKAGGSEFQIHYRALNVHIEKDGFEVVLSIPTTYYNFKQEVSSGSVDYELDDIDNEAEAVKSLSEENVRDLLTKLPLFNAMNGAGYKVSFKEGNFGSIHRHPGRFGFSSIDLGKDPESPGVIYRQKECTDFFQTDSVMYISGKECEIYTTEARIVNLKAADDGGVDGDYCQIPTISIVRPVDVTSVTHDPASAVLGEVDDDVFAKFHFVGAFGAELKKYPVLEVILELLETLDYNTDISNIDPNRITQKYSYLKSSGYGSKKNHSYGGRGYSDFYGADPWGGWEDYDDDWPLYGGVAKPKKDAFSEYRDKSVHELPGAEMDTYEVMEAKEAIRDFLWTYNISDEDEVEEILMHMEGHLDMEDIANIFDYAIGLSPSFMAS